MVRVDRKMNTTSIMWTILGYSLDEPQGHALGDIGAQLPIEFIEMLSEIDIIDALRACLIFQHLSSHTIIPRILLHLLSCMAKIPWSLLVWVVERRFAK